MAIEAQFLDLIGQTLARRRTATSVPLRALLLSYPDLLVSKAMLETMFGAELVAKLPARTDAHDIWKWHGLAGVTEPMFDSNALFAALGIETTVIDIVKARGMERVVDLNQPLPPDLDAKFDFVIDTGTCEHCFNVGQAFKNACSAVAMGGYLIHAAPMSRMNHGFWNFNPTVYPDFFDENGFKIAFMSGMTCNLREGFKPISVDPFRRFSSVADSAIFVVAERIDVRPFRWPMQRKYRGVPQ